MYMYCMYMYMHVYVCVYDIVDINTIDWFDQMVTILTKIYRKGRRRVQI